MCPTPDTGAYVAPKRTWFIRSINLLEGLSPAEIQHWLAGCGVRTFARGERIVDGHSTPPEQVLVVLEGAVRLLVERASGRSETVDVLGPGQLFGVSAAFGSSSTVLHADALTSVAACAQEGRSFLMSLASSPDLVLNLVRQAGARIVQFDGDYLRPPPPASAEARLAQELERLASAAGETVRDGSRIPACVSRGTLARVVGCTRETIARALSDLESAGGVVRHGRTLVVDLERLDDIARSSGSYASGSP